MNKVEAIKDLHTIRAIKRRLRTSYTPRDFLLFTMGINVALRITDLLSIQVKDVLKASGEVKEFLYLTESKNKKRRKIKINETAKDALEWYFSQIDQKRSQWLFPSHRNAANPFDRNTAWKLLNRVCREVGLEHPIGTHTLRKTWGYHARKLGEDISVISEKLGHNNITVTKRYLGITEDEVNRVEERVQL